MKKIDMLDSLLDPDHLRAFLAVTRFKNVTKAAEHLGRTQSAISVQIKHLEANLNAVLFERQARGVSLTPAGERFAPEAQRLVDDLRRTRAMFAEPISGHVRVGLPDDYGTSILQDILQRYSQTHPRVDVCVQCAFSARFPDLLKNGSLDLAAYVAEPDLSSGELLLDEAMVWASHKAWTPSQGPVPLALFDRDCWWRQAAIESLARCGIAYRAAFSSESLLGIKAAIASGLAVGVLAKSTVDETMRILGAKDGFPHLPRSRLVLSARNDSANPAVEAMADAIRQGFPGVRG